MTSKRSRFYQVGFFVVTFAFITLCAYMGITAMQKSLTLKMQFNTEPAVSCEFAIRQANSTLESDFALIFKNYDNSEIGDGTSLSGNTLIFESDKYDNFTGSAMDIKFTNKTSECSAIKLSVLNVTVGGNTGYSVFIPQNGVQVIEDISCPAGEDVVFQMEYVAEITFNLSYAQVSSVNGLTLKTGSTYYAVYGTTPSATLVATDNHMNPPQGVSISNDLGSYSSGTVNFDSISQDVTVTVVNSDMQTYAVVEELTKADVSYAISPTHGQDFTFTVTIDNDCTQVEVSYKIGSGEYITLSNPTPNNGVYTYTISSANVTNDLIIKAVGLSSYTITYNANGGSFSNSETTSSVPVTAGSNYTLPTPPTRTEYNFLGWADDSNDASPDWETGNQTANSDKTWYAVWELKTYRFTYTITANALSYSHYSGLVITNDDECEITFVGNTSTDPGTTYYKTKNMANAVAYPAETSFDITKKYLTNTNDLVYYEYYHCLENTSQNGSVDIYIPANYKIFIFSLHAGYYTSLKSVSFSQSINYSKVQSNNGAISSGTGSSVSAYIAIVSFTMPNSALEVEVVCQTRSGSHGGGTN
ncbi:MAG: InlB B-repeat-containing protein [Clostridia bacterium]|nr:InlB B-repeat-containing protein [Clostridia bacterium]